MTQSSMQKARLEDTDNITGNLVFQINQPMIKIGRSQKNDLVIKQTTVSNKHATIEQTSDGYFIVDLKSSNKTRLNGSFLEPDVPHKLNDGDEIKFHKFSFVFKLENIEPFEPPPDEDETIFFDSRDLFYDGEENESSDPAVDEGEEECFDSATLIKALKKTTPCPSVPDSGEAESPAGNALAETLEKVEPDGPMPDVKETEFPDNNILIEELIRAKTDPLISDDTEAEPSLPATDDEDTKAEVPQPALDDETIFFDSSTLDTEDKKTQASRPALDDDETIFFDGSTLGDEGKEAVLKPETKKIGNYDVIKLLGKGGFGSVWKAISSDGRPVAIKVLNPDVMDNERAVRKFFHEAINLAKMDHPNICRFIDFFPHEGNFAIVMDFVEGTDLQELLKTQNGPLPFDTARMIASQALDALHYAHQKHVLHRDIKPENITLTTEGVAKIMDFGIARLSSSESHQTSLFMISPAYTAPERFDVNKVNTVDHRADIYALGLVFYEIFTGTHPFQTTNPTEMIKAHLSTVPTSPDQIVDLPQSISDGILKSLEKDPEDRFKDFAEFKMEMLGEAPLRVFRSAGPLEFSGKNCKSSAAFLKALSGVVKKHQKQARKITVGQVGTKIEIVFETVSGNSIRITRDLGKI